MSQHAAATTESTDSEASRAFASDNWSGAHPEVIEAIARANAGHVAAYGGDPYTARFQEVARQHFGADAEAFPVFNGTGANVLALQAALPRWGAVICARTAHINTDEAGAPEKTGGLKLFGVDTPDGKLTTELVAREAWGYGSEHRSQPLAVSISQVTELGTVYTADEIRALADQAHELGMVLHVDGSRLANAAAHLGTTLGALTTEAGVDLLSLGGTKNGLLGAEAIVVLRPGAASGIPFLRKIDLQLASKMRFISAQLVALYEGDLWLRSASRANELAQRLAAGLRALEGTVPGFRIAQPVESNAVFAELPAEVAARAQAQFAFGAWPTQPGLYRLMCAFDTTEADVDALLAALRGA
ncbi:threonine aldolase family protein [Leucobacter japonicus]|uniref:threonine aldolase family protein n=1 Tax=Leucobacter japonicus TaxID=1461259 RepID=UPI0006A7BB78|nr:beta-eliminating lyase-related protein [Leucobacter japonicus]